MSSPAVSVHCASCGRPLEESPQLLVEQRLPCPGCGATARRINAMTHEKLTLKSKIGYKIKRPGFKKPIYEGVSGDDLHRKTGLWSKLVRIIDRENNRYKEEITNSTNGETLRSVDEALTDHVGRGSARKPGGKGDGDA